MRDCVFLVADKNMQAAFEGFLTKNMFHRSIGCECFGFDPRKDMAVAAGDNDPGLFTRGHELLRPYQSTHHYAVVVLDAEWDGSPGEAAIVRQLEEKIRNSGWQDGKFKVIVIDPELECWIWQQSDHVAKGLGFANKNELLLDADLAEAWPEGQSKPCSPKESLEKILRKRRIPRSSAIYRRISSQVSIKRCKDVSFLALVEALRTWFPCERAEPNEEE